MRETYQPMTEDDSAMATERYTGGLGHHDYDGFTVPQLTAAEWTRVMNGTPYAGVQSVRAAAVLERPLSAAVAARTMEASQTYQPNPATQAVHESFQV